MADEQYVYLTVPKNYECVYKNILLKLSDLGIDIIKDCTSTCKGYSRQLINCWNMFQAACAAYELGETKKADVLIKYIMGQLQIDCSETPITLSISNFALNVTDVTGAQTINISRATFNLNDVTLAQPNSLKILYLNDLTHIVQGASVNSPVAFTNIPLNVVPNTTYRWKAIVTDLDGVEHESNTYSIVCKEKPIVKENTMYYGNTPTAAQAFNVMPIDQIMALPGCTPKVISGTANNTFIMNQTERISYLLIPDTLMDLVKAEFGDVLITTLWNNATQSGAYKTSNPGGTYNGIHYRVFFFYAPGGAFPEDFRITVKNK